jgi:hypothetical protein
MKTQPDEITSWVVASENREEALRRELAALIRSSMREEDAQHALTILDELELLELQLSTASAAERIRLEHTIRLATMSLDTLSLERDHRQPWHTEVENALVAMFRSGRDFSWEEILMEACIGETSPNYEDASVYAQTLLSEAVSKAFQPPTQTVNA